MLILLCTVMLSANPEPKIAKEALQPFNDFIGTWRCTGQPEGTREERAAGFWQEAIIWQWNFKKGDVSLVGTIEKGKNFSKFELRYLLDKKQYELTATGLDMKSTRTFVGSLATGKTKEQILTLDHSESASETQRLVFTLLHHNRYLYRFETRTGEMKAFTRKYQVGSTKEGEPFASGSGQPECIVTGGRGTIPVTYKGQTYLVCCSGCRDVFKEDPEKYIKEYEAKKKQK